jgi:hypothetical protein
MTDKYGWVWQERGTRDWFWIEKKGEKYFSSSWITCIDAVLMLQGRKPAPETDIEVEDISRFQPVSPDIIEMMMRAIGESEAWGVP